MRLAYIGYGIYLSYYRIRAYMVDFGYSFLMPTLAIPRLNWIICPQNEIIPLFMPTHSSTKIA